MTKLRKQRRRKRYRYNVNRKRLRNKINNVGKIKCKEISDEWERHKSIQTNLKEMGLSYDPNETIKIENIKKVKPTRTFANNNEWMEEDNEILVEDTPPLKKTVAQKLLIDAKAPRLKMLRLPGSQVEWLTYLMETYGKDYRAMARDKQNYNQETWKQIRQKIKLFKTIPHQYSQYLKKKGISKEMEDDTYSSDGEL